MTRHIGSESADHRRAGQSQIADRIEQLVAHEFVAIAQTFGIDDAVAVKGDRIVERGAEGEAHFPEPLDIADKAECARPSDLVAEDARIEFDDFALAADGRRGKIDLDVEAEAAIGRTQFGISRAAFDADRLDDFQIAARRREARHPDLVDRGDERRGRTVEDRRFRPVNFNHRVVDAEPGQSRQEMLDRGDRGLAGIAEHRAELRLRDVRPFRFDQPFAASRQAGAQKTTPELASAGCRMTVTGALEWTPTPEIVTRSRSVVCRPNFIKPLPLDRPLRPFLVFRPAPLDAALRSGGAYPRTRHKGRPRS